MSASTLVSGVSGPFPTEAVATRTRTSGLFVYMCQSTRGGGGGGVTAWRSVCVVAELGHRDT